MHLFTKQAYSVLKCALTIVKFEDIEYGAWWCDLRTMFSSPSYGIVLRVDYLDLYRNNSTKDEVVKIRTDDVYVKRGDPFMVNLRHKYEMTCIHRSQENLLFYIIIACKIGENRDFALYMKFIY